MLCLKGPYGISMSTVFMLLLSLPEEEGLTYSAPSNQCRAATNDYFHQISLINCFFYKMSEDWETFLKQFFRGQDVFSVLFCPTSSQTPPNNFSLKMTQTINPISK